MGRKSCKKNWGSFKLKLVFCTLFDSNYLDKGLAMYRSLSDTCENYDIYILAMDNLCESILNAYDYQNMTIINLQDFVHAMRLEEAKANRSRGEFCWTCSSHLIDYVLSYYNEEVCTYIDADLYFYSDPVCLIKEMGGKTVQIVEHRFDNSLSGKTNISRSGRFCVEFNTFKKENKSIELLQWWEKQCVNNCSIHDKKSKVFGDQAYLNGWENYEYVSILKNLGGGVAPWNIAQYTLESDSKDGITLKSRKTDSTFNLVFYHFHNISYLSSRTVSISVYQRAWRTDKKLVDAIYLPYLKKLDAIKNEVKEKFDFYPLLCSHPELSKSPKKKNLIDIVYSVIEKGVREDYVIINDMLCEKINGKKNIITF